MKLSLLLILLVSSLFSSTIEKKREITLYGKIDSRLYASLISVYRSFDPYEVEQTEENKECFRKDWNTATKKATLGYDIAEIIPDKDGNYKVTIPIDYKGVNPCGYEYVATRLRIQRNENEKGFVSISILDSVKSGNYRTPGSGMVGVKTIETDKKYLQLSSGTKIVCYTEHHQDISRRTKKYEESTNLVCEPMVANENNGVDKIKSVELNIDIVVNKNSFLYDSTNPNFVRGKPFIEDFREYKEPPTFFEKIKNFFSDII